MSHGFVLDELLQHIEERAARSARFDAPRLGEWASEKNARARLQTLPGIDVIGVVRRLAEIGRNRSVLALPDRLASWVG